MVDAMRNELILQKSYLTEPVETIYFGGGTPSLLEIRELNLLLETIAGHYDLPSDFSGMEITLEANPDDLTPEKIRALRQTPVNRLSIGIQSFADADLHFMNRAHHAGQALSCLENVQLAGFENLTIDLIYGAPTTTDAQWATNIETAIRLGVPHLSCYCLTVEPRTALAHFVKTGKAAPVDEEQSARQFSLLVERTAAAGYDHYEISNFARPGWHSRHNAAYWQGKPYLGIGPAAHSFDGNSRQWNLANNARYMQALQSGKIPFEKEMLTPVQQYNEYVMTSLRTMWGCNLRSIRLLGFEVHFLKEVEVFVAKQLIRRVEDAFILTDRAKFLADGIAADLFADEGAA